MVRPRLRKGLHDGSITVAFRRWHRPQVVTGHQYRTGAGMVRKIDVITPADITPALARMLASPTLRLRSPDLRGDRFPMLRPVPHSAALIRRDRTGGDGVIPEDDAAMIGAKLARMDALSKRGPWTAAVLQQITSSPGRVSSVFLAQTWTGSARISSCTCRRLKALGLTISLDVGYGSRPAKLPTSRARPGPATKEVLHDD